MFFYAPNKKPIRARKIPCYACYVVTLNKNTLKISTIDKEAQLKTAIVDVPKELVDDTRIIDPKGFSNILDQAVSQVSVLSKNKLGLNFVMEPQDLFLRYVTVSKNGQEIGEQIVSEIKAKDPDINLDNLYFSYKKMAPFVYQFIGIRKEVVDNYLETSNESNIGLKSIIPWVLAFPKYENVNDPSIFVSKVDDDQVIALSELNGVFFAGTYKKEKTPEELTALIKELSFYKRSSPIKYIYTFNCESFTMPGYEIKKIEAPKFNGNFNLPEDFEINNVEGKMVSLLPFPKVENLVTDGLNWELKNEDLEIIKRIGTRNFATKSHVKISYSDGDLLVFIGQ